MGTLISSECTHSSFHGPSRANKSELQTLFLLIGSLSCRDCSCHCFRRGSLNRWDLEVLCKSRLREMEVFGFGLSNPSEMLHSGLEHTREVSQGNQWLLQP